MTYNTQYYILLKRVLEEGVPTDDRTGEGHIKVFDHTMTYNVGDRGKYDKYHLPVLKLRKVSPRIAFEELLWMLRGSTDVTELQEKNVHIWNGNSTREFLDSVGLHHIRENHIGKAYGHQFRNFGGIDQLEQLFLDLSYGNYHRRHLINLWNAGELDEMALAPCVYSYQFVPVGGVLNLKVVQRSCDVILGQPTNAMFSSMFLVFMAKICGMEVGRVSHTMVDVHIYKNHIDAAKLMVERYEQWALNKQEKDLDDVECDARNLSILVAYNTVEHGIDVFLSDMGYGTMGVPLEYDSFPAIDKSKLIMAV